MMTRFATRLIIYYSNFDKHQNFIFVYRTYTVNLTSKILLKIYSRTIAVQTCHLFCVAWKRFLQTCRNDGPPPLPLKLLSLLPTLSNCVIHPLLLVHSTAKLFSKLIIEMSILLCLKCTLRKSEILKRRFFTNTFLC